MNPIALACLASSLAVAGTSFWLAWREPDGSGWLRGWVFPCLMALVLAGGLWAAVQLRERVEAGQREELLAQATAIARTIFHDRGGGERHRARAGYGVRDCGTAPRLD